MTNRKSTKRALLGSVMAMVLCLAMLVGATFAWFTDTASTGVNKIQAGNLDVALEMQNADGKWVSAEIIPGRCAAPPAPAMMTLKPWSAAPCAKAYIRSGVRWAETIRAS